ncbi:MAG: site-specific tyrosine recombinase XerC [Devosia sp.]|nr:site-specific tyrosine recombinase XerC [Devosia sp.]
MEARIKGLVKDTDRHGNDRYYLRIPGRKKVRLREPIGSDAFLEEVRCARLGIPYRKDEPPPAEAKASPKALPGSLKWLSLEYLRRACADLEPITISKKSSALTFICDTVIAGKEQVTYATLPYRLLAAEDCEHIRDLQRDEPNGANFKLKTISAMFKWAMTVRDGNGQRLADHNPTLGVVRLSAASDGYHTWTRDEIATYRKHHAPRSQADLAFILFFFTGARCCDVARLGRQNLYEGPVRQDDGTVITGKRLRVRPKKTRKQTAIEVDIPVPEPLVEAIEAIPKTQMVFLQSRNKRAYSDASLSNMMAAWCHQAGIPHCSAHGLRKAYSVLLAEGGTTPDQLKAMLGWSNTRTAEIYTRAAERRRLADAGSRNLRLT